MSTTFTLTVTVTGNSLSEVDDALCAAAGERLLARLQNPPKLNGQVLHRGETVDRKEEAKQAARLHVRNETPGGTNVSG